MEFHFVNVGHGDCTFVSFPSGRLAMIDINNTKSLPEADVVALAEAKGMSVDLFKSAQLAPGARSWKAHYESLLADPVDYYRQHFDGVPVFRYIQSHPDMDHMGGLHRFFWQEKIPLLNFWDIHHEKKMSESDFEASPHQYVDWLTYELMRLGRGPDESALTVIRNRRGSSGQYWTDDDVRVLAPTTTLEAIADATENWNIASQVLRFEYAGRSIILPGDAENAAWTDIVAGVDPQFLNCDILKAAHHGRDSGYHDQAVSSMDPSIVVVSVGKKPATDASEDYKAKGATVLSTRYHGSIHVKVWYDGEVWVYDGSGNRIASLPSLS